MYLASYVYAPEVIVAPLLSAILVFNAMLAPLMNRERFGLDSCMYLSIVVLGCVLTTLSASICVMPATPNVAGIIIYALIMLAIMLICVYVVAASEIYKDRKGANSAEFRKIAPMLHLACPTLAGLGISCASMLGRTVVMFPEQLAIMIFLIVVCVVASLIIINLAFFAALDAVPIVTVFVATVIIFNIIGGGMIFEEFSSFGTNQIVLFASGLVFIVAGTHMIAHEPVYAAVGQDDEATELNAMT